MSELFGKMFGDLKGTPYTHTFTPGAVYAPDWLTDDQAAAVRAFVEEHGDPTGWEIEGRAGEFVTTHCTFADGAVLSFSTSGETL